VCRVVKPLESYYKHKRHRDGHVRVCIPCQTAKGREYNRTHSEEKRISTIKWRKAHPVKYLVNKARARCRRNGMEFNITADDLPWPDVCPLLGIPVLPCGANFGRGKNKPWLGPRTFTDGTASIDRIDSSKGYVRGNVWIISWKANQLKQDATLAQLESIVAGLKKRLANVS